jgi:hypothetical protein
LKCCLVEISVTIDAVGRGIGRIGGSSVAVGILGRGIVTVGIGRVHVLMRESEVEGYRSGRIGSWTDIGILRSIWLTHGESISTIVSYMSSITL